MQIIKSTIALFYAILMSLGLFSVDMDKVELKNVPILANDDTRVISFNLRTANDIYGSVKNRSKFFKKVIDSYHPDSFGVQECSKKWYDILPSDFADEYDFVGQPRSDGAGAEYNLIFFLKNKYELLDSGTIWLSKTPEKFGSKSFSSSMPRICTWAVLKDKQSGKTYAHLNTHLDHLLEKARVGQSGVLLEKAEELSQQYPLVITGDFNTDEYGESYKLITSKYSDSRLIAENTQKGKTFHNYGRGDLVHKTAIDFIFVSHNIQVDTYKIIDDMIEKMYISDHYGLCVDFNF